MGRRIYPLGGIRYWYCYDTEEVCALYKSHRLHPQTVRQWIKNGLPTVDRENPAIIYGNDLKNFLGKMNQANKCQIRFEEMYCLKCRDAKPPLKKQIQLQQQNRGVQAKARCQTCKGIMNKGYKLEEIPRLLSVFDVVDVLELYDCDTSAVNTHILNQAETRLNEPTQMELILP